MLAGVSLRTSIHRQVRAILLAAALMLVPLGARTADLVVWWEEGFHPEEDGL
jgi:hypothetical protein